MTNLHLRNKRTFIVDILYDKITRFLYTPVSFYYANYIVISHQLLRFLQKY
jgi:hypothetical protein